MSEHLKALEAQHAELAAQIAAAKAAAKAGAVAQVKAVMAEHGLSLADVAGTPSAVKSSHSSAGVKRGKVAVKFSHPLTGEKWTGRGQKPRWLAAELALGHHIDEFKLAA